MKSVLLEVNYLLWKENISVTGSLASTVGAKNPYRYRGYRLDTETGLYYLNSRYYNLSWGSLGVAAEAETFVVRTGVKAVLIISYMKYELMMIFEFIN